MAPRTEEVFTDLTGKPDVGAGADDAAELERGLAALNPKGAKIEDADLEVSDDEDEDADTAAEVDETDADADAGEEAEEAEQAQVSDFDPKDVVILTKDAELVETRKSGFTQAETSAKAAIELSKADMLAAQEAGESAKNIAATERYTAATIALRDAQDGLKQVTADEKRLRSRAQELYAKAPKDADGKPVLTGADPGVRRAAAADASKTRGSKLAEAFKKLNPWFGHAKYKAQSDILMKLDRGLAAEGRLNKDDPAYFVELGRRFNAEKPGLYKTLDGKKVATGSRQRGSGTPIPGAGNGGGSQVPEGSKVKLTSEDLVQMRKFSMDPDNKDHRRQWLQDKRELAAKETRAA